MNITVDTNVLVRSLVRDDAKQAAAADRLLRSADLIAVPLPTLCELVWVLLKVYHLPREDVAAALRALLQAGNVKADRKAAEAGLAVFDAGGDFADGVIAHEGQRLGGETFVSFDKQAVKLIKAADLPTRAVP